MRTWLIRSGVIGMALIWTVGWGAGAGGFIEAFVDPILLTGLLGALSGPGTWLLFRYAGGGHAPLASPPTR